MNLQYLEMETHSLLLVQKRVGRGLRGQAGPEAGAGAEAGTGPQTIWMLIFFAVSNKVF